MFALAFILLCSAAHADLYRWVDPETGSVKFSNNPPPWYERGSGPAVERVPYDAPRAQPALSGPTAIPELRARWREALLALSVQRSPENARALAQVAAELDKLDPAGARRRSEETAAVLRGAPQ